MQSNRLSATQAKALRVIASHTHYACWHHGATRGTLRALESRGLITLEFSEVYAYSRSRGACGGTVRGYRTYYTRAWGATATDAGRYAATVNA